MNYALGALGWIIIIAIASGRGAEFPAEAVGTILLWLGLIAATIVAAAVLGKNGGKLIAACMEGAWWLIKHLGLASWFLVCLLLGTTWSIVKGICKFFYRLATK